MFRLLSLDCLWEWAELLHASLRYIPYAPRHVSKDSTTSLPQIFGYQTPRRDADIRILFFHFSFLSKPSVPHSGIAQGLRAWE